MNWTVDNNGAYDYAADTRGFTFATMLEYHERRWAVRFAEALMPKVANGIHLDADMRRARAENIEFELHGTMLRHQEGTIRFLSFINHANHGQLPRSDRQFSPDHQEYLALGGSGFLLGDGRLNYRRGIIIETYYTLHVWRLRLDCSTSTILATPGTGSRADPAAPSRVLNTGIAKRSETPWQQTKSLLTKCCSFGPSNQMFAF